MNTDWHTSKEEQDDFFEDLGLADRLNEQRKTQEQDVSPETSETSSDPSEIWTQGKIKLENNEN